MPVPTTRSECKTMPCASQDNDGSRVIAGSDAGVSLFDSVDFRSNVKFHINFWGKSVRFCRF